ncbi:glutaminase [Egbenema bharatensis]|uniref:glutaminase n=1 Tax=Egbenema bharatensis TaxID=3463334 RepID=UPI003A8781FE
MAALQSLQDLTQSQLEDWATQAIASAASGKVAQRIPLLAKTDPRWLAVEIHTQSGQRYALGETDRLFPLMSAIKPFLLLYLLEKFGRKTVFQWVGMMPSDQPFNSLNQLTSDRGRPRNPMINSGAIVLAGRLPGKTGSDRCQALCHWLNTQAGSQLHLDKAMLDSVRSAGREPNQALVRYLAETGYLAQPQVAIDTYEQICCLSGSVTDLSRLGNLLIDPYGSIAPHHRQTVNAIMLTCGLYEASPIYAVNVGLPMKSGISGALLAVIPQQGTIACYSPALDNVGNPIAGLHFVESLARHLQLSLFI